MFDFGNYFLSKDAQQAADWISSRRYLQQQRAQGQWPQDLNATGGVESDLTVSRLERAQTAPWEPHGTAVPGDFIHRPMNGVVMDS